MPSPDSLPVLDEKYQLTRQLGQGGMGAVYEAIHLGTSRRVAVKVISSGDLAKKPDLVDRFRREATVTGKIESQYIAHVTDAGVDTATGWPFMVMELLSGEDVEQAIARLGPLPPEVVIKIGAQACLGLQKAHESGVIHRDIKPANLYLTRRDGGEVVVKIVDFGIAKLKSEQGISSGEGKSLTRTGSLLGSPLYMSPEQAFGKKTTDHRTDIWSLGIVLYEALTGTTPHGDSETIGSLIIAICQQPPRPLQELAPWIPPEVASIVHKALALDPAARFATAAEMYAAIRACLPHGHSIDEAMFAPLTPAARAFAAPRVSLGSDICVPSPSMSELPGASASISGMHSAPTTGAGSTAFAQTAAVTQPHPGPRKRGMMPVVFGGAVLLAVAAGVVVAVTPRRAPPPTATAAAPPPSVAAAIAPPFAPPTVSAAPDPAPAPPPTATAVATPPPSAEPAPAPEPPRAKPKPSQASPKSPSTPAPKPAAPVDLSSVR